MNRLLLFGIALLLSIMAAQPSVAQQKIGYVDIAAIMKDLPEAQEAQRQLDAVVDQWQKQLQEMEDEWQALFNDYDKRKLILTEQGRAKAEKELQDLDGSIMQFRDQKFGQDGELFNEEDRLMRPIQDLVFDQINMLATEEGFDYIFDKSGGVMIIFAKPEYDMTKQAIERIKAYLPARDAPGTTAGQGGSGTGGTSQPTSTRPPTTSTPSAPSDDGRTPDAAGEIKPPR